MGVDVETEKEHRFFTSVFHTGYGPKIYTQDQYSRHKDWDGEKAYELVEAISRATVKLFASL